MKKNYRKHSILILVFNLLTISQLYASGYKNNINDFSLNRSSGTGCTAANSGSVRVSGIEIEIYSKTQAYLRIALNGVNVQYVAGTISGTTISFGTQFISIVLCNSTPVTTITSVTATFNITGNLPTSGQSSTSGTLSVSASGTNYSGTGTSINTNLPYTFGAFPSITVKNLSGSSVCSDTDIEVQVAGDNYTFVQLYMDGVQIGSNVLNDNSFSVNTGYSKFKIRDKDLADGKEHSIYLKVNSNDVSKVTFRSYNPFSNVQLSPSKGISCYGEAITFNVQNVGYSNVAYAWSGGASNAPPYTVNPTSSSDFGVTLYRTNNTDRVCPFVTNKVFVEAFANFNATVGANTQNVCKPSSITINAQPNDASKYNYLWSNGSNANSIQVTQNGNYKVTITPKNGCGGRESNTISNLSFEDPIATARVSPPDNAVICNITQGLALEAITDAGVGISWNTGETNSKIIVRTEGTFTATFRRGACVEQRSVTTKIDELRVNVSPASAMIVCKGTNYQPFSIEASSNYSNATIKWKLNTDATDAPGTNTDKKYSPTAGGEYYAIAEVAALNCKSSPSNKVRIAEISSFDVSVSPLNPSEVCEGRIQIFTATPTYTSQAVAYSWTQDGKPLAAATNTISANTEATYTINISREGCKASASSKMTLKTSRPSVNIYDFNELVASESTDSQYEWYHKIAKPSSPTDTLLQNYTKLSNTNQRLSGATLGTYVVRANRNSCGRASSLPIEVTTITAQENTIDRNWNIYPNPTSDEIIIENQNYAIQAYSIDIFDVTGKLIETQKIYGPNQKINLKYLPNGIFNLIIKHEGKQISKKIIKI